LKGNGYLSKLWVSICMYIGRYCPTLWFLKSEPPSIKISNSQVLSTKPLFECFGQKFPTPIFLSLVELSEWSLLLSECPKRVVPVELLSERDVRFELSVWPNLRIVLSIRWMSDSSGLTPKWPHLDTALRVEHYQCIFMQSNLTK
jgi:hypothetical protein